MNTAVKYYNITTLFNKCFWFSGRTTNQTWQKGQRNGEIEGWSRKNEDGGETFFVGGSGPVIRHSIFVKNVVHIGVTLSLKQRLSLSVI